MEAHMELIVIAGTLFELVATSPEEEIAIRQMLDAANERSGGKLTIVGIIGKKLHLISNKI